YVTARGLTSSPIPHGRNAFQIDFDFLDHTLVIQTHAGAQRHLPLVPQSVAAFHAALLERLAELGLPVRIHGSPNEVLDAIPFHDDTLHHDFDTEAAQRFWRVLVRRDHVFKQFRTGFLV